MKKSPHLLAMIMTRYSILLFLAGQLCAQGYDNPLTIQGIDHNTIQSAASRAEGGITIGIENDVSTMFVNPASMQSLSGLQISIGGLEQYTSANQVQQYAPLKYYSNFSLLMEGLTGYISNPDTSFHGTNAGDTVQRPFDNIGPNWRRKAQKGLPVQAMIGIPLKVGDIGISIGIGAVEYANLNHYYQNNNVLFPAIGSERPIPTPLPKGTDSLPVQWSQYLRQRDGSIRGYGLAFSISPIEKLSLGISTLALTGSTDDYEQHTGRGTLLFFANWFRLDSVYNRVTSTGTSNYSGQEFTFSGIYHAQNISVGFSIKPPLTITRTFTSRIQTDTSAVPTVTTVSGEDKIRLPWRGTLGLSLLLKEYLTLGLEYELRSFASAVYTNTTGAESNPWLSSSVLHLGAEYRAMDWLSLRVGLREQAEVFEPEGNPIIGDPVSYRVYTAGCGLKFERIRLNLTYEYGSMNYDDAWQTNVNLNHESRHTVMADIVYDLPWTW